MQPTSVLPIPLWALGQFDRLGIRVPLVAISPYARQRYVSHSQHQTTSILRFIQLVFDLPALTNRDANSDAMLDLFDFSTPALMDAPAPADAETTRTCP